MITTRKTIHMEPIIREAYASDQALLDKWHIISGSGLDACVKDTITALTKETYPDFAFHVLEDNGLFVGYFGNEADRSYLNTFFIAPEQRSRKLEIWQAVVGAMEPAFLSAIYSKNTPCMRFYEKMGKPIQTFRVPGRKESVTLFKFENHRSQECH